MKKLVLATTLLLLAGLSTGQSLQNFEYNLENGFEKDLTGGEAFNQEINFSNTAERPVPLALEIKVDGENFSMSSSGDEFDLGDSSIRIKDYSVYDYWNAIDERDEFPFKVMELENPGDDVPQKILVMNGACTGPGELRSFDLGDDCSSEDDLENVPGVDISNLSVEKRPEYDSDDVEGSISHDLLPGDRPEPIFDPDNSTVVPILYDGALTDVEEGSDVAVSDYSLVPARFDFYTESVSLDASYEQENDAGLYRFPYESSLMISDGADVSIEVVFDSSVRIRPDSYSFEFDVRSDPGFASATESKSIDNGTATVEVEGESVDASVDISAEEDNASVTVESYEETTVSPPEPDSEFVGGLGVEVTKNESEVDSSGNISISYDQELIDERALEEESMGVYYFNESRAEWTTEGAEVINRDTEDNVITAEASHFSVYAAFAEEESSSQDTESSDSGWVDWTPESTENSTDTSSENTTEDDVTQEPSDTEESSPQDSQDTEGPQEDDEQASENISGEQDETVDEMPNNQLTGLFTDQPSDTALPVLAAVLIGLLIYFYRERLKELY